MGRSSCIAVTVMLAVACGQPPPATRYELRGQILGIKLGEMEVLIKHEDIKNFMPGMTMPFKVRDAVLLEGRRPGDLITATLVLAEHEAHLETLTAVGHAPVDVPPAPEIRSGFELFKTGDIIPNQLLIDQDGRPLAIESLRGHRVALTFIYTRCPMPTFCPLMDRHFASLQREVMAAPALADVRLLSISFDPEFDRPAVLKAHAAKHRADPRIWNFATGDRDDVTRLAARFGLGVQRDERNPIEISHTLRTAVLDTEGRLVKIRSGNSWTPADILADLSGITTSAH